MERATTSPVLNRGNAENLLSGMLANYDDPVHVHLFVSGPGTITPDTVPADFTEASFVGYAVKNIAAVDWVQALLSPNGNAVCGQAILSWVGGAIVAPGQTVHGYYVTNTANTGLLFSEQFTDPVFFVAPGNFLNLTVQQPLLMVGSIA